MTMALKLAIDFAFKEMGLTKIIAIITKQNNVANKLLGRLNFMQAADLQNDEIEYYLKDNI